MRLEATSAHYGRIVANVLPKLLRIDDEDDDEK